MIYTLTYAIFNGERVNDDFTFETYAVEAGNQYDAIGWQNEELSARYMATRRNSYMLMEIETGNKVNVHCSLDNLEQQINFCH